jgi:DNA invertase Pin-like site-specific DNA recombinase
MSSYVMYCRKSSESEDRQVLSIESQINELTELAKRLNLPVSEILTEARSAKEPGRPVFDTMMKRVYKGEIKGILTWKADRLARNPIDGGVVMWALKKHQIKQIVTPTVTYRNNSNEKFLMNLDFGLATKYVDDLSDNVKRGNKTKLEKGWLPGRPPLGYLNEPTERTIVRDPERFVIIRKMWDLLLKGVSPYKIRRIANNDWGLRTRKTKRTGNNPITQSEIYKIFGNPFYYGLIRRKDGVFPGRHEKMITEDEYNRAQELLGRKGQPRPKVHEFAFTGLIRCGECGCMVTAEEKDNAYGTHYVYYRCTKKKDGHRCRQKYINVKQLESQVIDYLEKVHVPDRLLNIAIGILEERRREQKAERAVVEKSVEQALTTCRRKLDNLNQMRLNDLIDDEEYSVEKRKLAEEKIGLEKKISEGCQPDTLDAAEETLTFANLARDRFQNGSIEDKRAILMRIGSNFLLKDRILLIQAKKPISSIEKTLQAIKDENDTLELVNIGSVEPKIEGFLRAFA